MYQRRYFTQRMFERVDALKTISAQAGLTLAELAYAWTARRPGIDSILIGPGDLAQFEEALRCTSLVLASELLARIEAFHLEDQGTDVRYAR